MIVLSVLAGTVVVTVGIGAYATARLITAGHRPVLVVVFLVLVLIGALCSITVTCIDLARLSRGRPKPPRPSPPDSPPDSPADNPPAPPEDDRTEAQ